MNMLNKLFTLVLLCSCVAALPAMDSNKKCKINQNKKQNRAKRVKVTPKKEELYGVICPKCDTEWLAQTDECPGCGISTGLGDGYDVIGRFFVPKEDQ